MECLLEVRLFTVFAVDLTLLITHGLLDGCGQTVLVHHELVFLLILHALLRPASTLESALSPQHPPFLLKVCSSSMAIGCVRV